jgi:endo-1,4-beta-xylanase
MREYIDRVMRRYAGDIALWDVVNESFEDDGRLRNSVWYQAMGERYIDIAFRQARQSDPLATLIYNDYDVAWFGPKADAMFTMLQGLRDRGVPIDGVGFQMHVYAAFDAFEELRANIRRAESMGLDVYITEFDVSMVDDNTEEQQAAVYAEVLSICLEEAACRAVQTWGFTDQYSWRRDFTPLILDTSYQPKPAYFALQSVLEGN